MRFASTLLIVLLVVLWVAAKQALGRELDVGSGSFWLPPTLAVATVVVAAMLVCWRMQKTVPNLSRMIASAIMWLLLAGVGCAIELFFASEPETEPRLVGLKCALHILFAAAFLAACWIPGAKKSDSPGHTMEHVG